MAAVIPGNSNRRNPAESPKKGGVVPGSPNKPPRGAANRPWRSNSGGIKGPSFSSSPSRNHNSNTISNNTNGSNSNYLLRKLSKSLSATGSSTSAAHRALEYALQAVRFFEEEHKSSSSYPSASSSKEIELTMSLHALAAVYCRLRQYGEAIAVLERSLKVPNPDKGIEQTLAIFSGHMHLGDTYALMGRHSDALAAYHTALDLQKKTVGDRDARLALTYRYLAEAHLQNLQFKEAEEMCDQLLKIHSQTGTPGSLEEAADRRLMALICSGKGEHDLALEYLVLASMSLISNGQDQKALTVFKSAKGEDDISVACVYVSCETALKLYAQHEVRHPLDEITSGLTEIAALYAAMNEPERALHLLSKVLDMIEAYLGKYGEALVTFKSAVMKLRSSCVELYEIVDAAECFQEARSLLEHASGPNHADTIAVCTNLAATYDALGRFDDAISLLQTIINAKEKMPGIERAELANEKQRLNELHPVFLKIAYLLGW